MMIGTVYGAEIVRIGSFSSGSLQNWEAQRFEGETQYRLTNIDGVKVLKAESAGSASGLFKAQRVDLSKTPFLNWRWRIDSRLGNRDEQSRSGDDYAARVYVVVSGGLAFWRKKAVNYVWAGASHKGKIWSNAFAGDSVMMIAMRSSDDDAATWYAEKRNVAEDFRELFGEDIRFIDAVAIMTDTDNAGGSVAAYYGDIYFSAD